MRSLTKPRTALALVGTATVLLCGQASPAFAASPAIEFESMVSVIEPDTLSAIEEAATRLKEDPTLEVWIVGYRTLHSPPSYGQILAHNRLVQAYRALTQAGIAAERIYMANLGEAPNGTDAHNVPKQLTLTIGTGNPASSTPAKLLETSGDRVSFDLHFPPNSRQLNKPQEGELEAFLGQHLGSTGARVQISAQKNEDQLEAFPIAMQRLRGLVAYKMLVEKGFPASRIDLDPPEVTNANPSESPSVANNERVVTLTWINVTEPMATLPKPEPIVVEEAPAKPQTPATEPFLKVSLSAGFLMPSGAMASVATGAPSFALTARGSLLDNTLGLGCGYAWRVGLARGALEPVDSGQTGELVLSNLQVGFDKSKKFGNFNLFAGAQLGLHLWQGRIKETSSGTVNKDEKFDAGAGLVFGSTYEGFSNLSIGPELQWNIVSGGFGGTYLVPAIILGWRL